MTDSGFAGRYKITVHKADGTVKSETPWFSNLITDAGLDRLALGNIVDRALVGSGSSAVSFADTALENEIAQSTTQVSIDDGEYGYTESAPFYSWARRQFTFAQGVATGVLREVGVGWSAGLFSHALITNGSGTPTPITVAADEAVDITYELRIYPKIADTTFSWIISGVTHNCTLRPARITDNGWVPFDIFNYGINSTYRLAPFEGSIQSIYSKPDFEEYYGATPNGVYLTYIPGTYYADMTFNYNLTDAVFTSGIGAVMFMQNRQGGGQYQLGFNPKIQKSASDRLSLAFRFSWSRYSE